MQQSRISIKLNCSLFSCVRRLRMPGTTTFLPVPRAASPLERNMAESGACCLALRKTVSDSRGMSPDRAIGLGRRLGSRELKGAE
jgi:hypothetical protein